MTWAVPTGIRVFAHVSGEKHHVEQQHLPDRLAGRRYYQPGDLGLEAKIKEWWERLRRT